MHLQSLRESNGCQYACALLEPCVTIADATLNSWKQAHDAFNTRRFKVTKPSFIDGDTHRYFTTLVKQAIHATEDPEMIAWGTNTYPSEAIAYAVLKLWIEQEQNQVIKDKFARELEWAASNVEDHTVELICGKGSNEIWRCTNKGSSCYGFDLVISRFGIAMYGDTDSLVFGVGSQYGIEFLARKSVCGYMISKLNSEYREKRELCEDSLKQALVEAGCRLLEDKFVPYDDSDDENEGKAELADWVGGSAPITLDMVIEEMQKHLPEQAHTLFETFVDEVDNLLTDRAPNGLQAVESFLSEHYDDLYLGPEWYEHTISKHDGSLITKLEMLRLCALKIQEVKNAGDGSEEHAV